LTSSKLQKFAKWILERLSIIHLFDGIYGSLPDGKYGDKHELISFVLKRENLSPNSSVMVGDRSHDIVGARANDTPCVGAAWGYGCKEELLAAGAAPICHSPKDLPECIDRILSPPPLLP
jgi:phosphoglycolate phosphatase